MECLLNDRHVSILLTACPSDLDLILWVIGHNCLSFYQRLPRSILP